MNSVIIERMQRPHIEEVLEIENASFSTPWSKALFYNELCHPSALIYVALLGSRVVGYICVHQVMDEGHILNLAVRQDMKRQGIAKTLVQRIIAELKESACKTIYLEVRISNYMAKHLYEGLGFKAVGIRKHYYESPKEDGIIMMLKIEESTTLFQT